ncbi:MULTISPECIES: hypothetical protein [unclassified Variovorax]|uniref:hypothetical protein n=1 Tax=unclassified Variovorax TaxID=663243 RepID=UPI003F450442
MITLIHTPLSAPARLVGSVDATHERCTPCPRTLAQAFGETNAGGVIVPMDDTARPHRAADTVLYIVGLFGIAMALAFNNWSPL